MFGRISLVLLAMTTVANTAVLFDGDEFGWAEQVAHENGSAKITDDGSRVRAIADYGSIINDVEFYLYTQDSKDNPIMTKVGDDHLFDGRIDKSKPIKILTHGYFSGRNRFFGKTLREGLDPAGPMFSCSDNERLKPESADFVDVIHTCGHGLGFYDTLGHVDFYPNHGVPNQPGCKLSFGKCSHARAIQLFAESLGPSKGFVARKCDHWKNFLKGNCDVNSMAYMGESVSWNARGRYWLKTNKASPYAMGLEASYGTSGNDSSGSHGQDDDNKPIFIEP